MIIMNNSYDHTSNLIKYKYSDDIQIRKSRNNNLFFS